MKPIKFLKTKLLCCVICAMASWVQAQSDDNIFQSQILSNLTNVLKLQGTLALEDDTEMDNKVRNRAAYFTYIIRDALRTEDFDGDFPSIKLSVAPPGDIFKPEMIEEAETVLHNSPEPKLTAIFVRVLELPDGGPAVYRGGSDRDGNKQIQIVGRTNDGKFDILLSLSYASTEITNEKNRYIFEELGKGNHTNLLLSILKSIQPTLIGRAQILKAERERMKAQEPTPNSTSDNKGGVTEPAKVSQSAKSEASVQKVDSESDSNRWIILTGLILAILVSGIGGIYLWKK